MEVSALCVRLLIKVLLMLFAQVQSSYCAQKEGAAFPIILPNRLQFFEYESISFTCEFEGSAAWRVMRTLWEFVPTNISNWVTSAGSGTIKVAFSSDSGKYWCEDGDGLRSNAVNISVTAGSVILESPVMPVMEGDHVTLHCKKKKSPADLIADFYKDGHRIRTGYKGSMTIYNISTSDEGLYKCNISGAGESAESRLVVRDFSDPDGERSHSPFSFLLMLFITCLLLVVLGVPLFRKHRGTPTEEVSKGRTKPRRPEESVYSTVYYTVGKVSYKRLRAETAD